MIKNTSHPISSHLISILLPSSSFIQYSHSLFHIYHCTSFTAHHSFPSKKWFSSHMSRLVSTPLFHFTPHLYHYSSTLLLYLERTERRGESWQKVSPISIESHNTIHTIYFTFPESRFSLRSHIPFFFHSVFTPFAPLKPYHPLSQPEKQTTRKKHPKKIKSKYLSSEGFELSILMADG